MPNLIPNSEALQALQAGPCRVARESWPWGKWVESRFSIPLFKGEIQQKFIAIFENDQFTSMLWEPEFADHSADDWYVLEERV